MWVRTRKRQKPGPGPGPGSDFEASPEQGRGAAARARGLVKSYGEGGARVVALGGGSPGSGRRDDANPGGVNPGGVNPDGENRGGLNPHGANRHGAAPGGAVSDDTNPGGVNPGGVNNGAIPHGTAPHGVDLDLPRGELTAVMGPSGSGKSTLMHCMSGLEAPDRGGVWIGDTDITGLDDAGMSRLRRDRVGFVFQAFNLVPTLTALENITLPMDLAGRRADRAWLDRLIAATGLAGRLGHRPAELSGGQQQRVAVARALIARPEVVFADEPTGNLDSRARGEVLDLLRHSVDALGGTVVMVTHDPAAAAYADRVVFLADGMLVGELRNPGADAVIDRMRDLDGHRPPGPRRAAGQSRSLDASGIPFTGGSGPEAGNGGAGAAAWY